MSKRTLFECSPATVRLLLAMAAIQMPLSPARSVRLIRLNPHLKDISRIVTSSPAGTTFVFAPGIYRNVSIAVKNDDTFSGTAGAILNGSEQLSFRRQGEGWTAQTNAALVEAVDAGIPCDPSLKNSDGSKYTIGCTHSRSLYRNGAPLWRVATLSEAGPGKWFFDNSTKVVFISDDPRSDTWELGETPDAFHGGGKNVTIRGLTIEKYAGAQQRGAVNCDSGNWLIQGNVIQLNHARGIGFGPCDGIKILENTIARNGDLGIGGSEARNAQIQRNEIEANNYARVDAGWEAGGGKWTKTTDLVISENRVHDNFGPGLWSDIDAQGTLYSANVVTKNVGPGILYEISRGARIEKNTVEANGNPLWRNPWLWDGQIVISASSDVVVENNTVIVAGYGNGITIADQNRGLGPFGERRASDNRVIGNTITYLTDQGGSGAASDREKPAIRNTFFNSNTYHFLGPKGTKGHFYWAGLVLDWDHFRATGNERTGQAVIGK